MARAQRVRLLDLLCEREPAADRERLLALVVCGDVTINGERIRDPQRLVPRDALPLIAATTTSFPGLPPRPYVSRGGDKLAPVLEAWDVPVAGQVFIDAGASTGGFTHCLLLKGASLVHAIDVGYNQLDYRLRTLAQVQVHERTNILSLTHLEPPATAAVADLSFRSLVGPAAHILGLVHGGPLYALIKPQFERRYGGLTATFDGVAPQSERRAILDDTCRRLAEAGVRVARLAPAGVKGARGNQEYFAELWLGSGVDNLSVLNAFWTPTGT